MSMLASTRRWWIGRWTTRNRCYICDAPTVFRVQGEAYENNMRVSFDLSACADHLAEVRDYARSVIRREADE